MSEYKKYVNGEYIEMTDEEVKEIENTVVETTTELSSEERLVNLENAMQDLILTTFGGE